jgi:hypothetical protein
MSDCKNINMSLSYRNNKLGLDNAYCRTGKRAVGFILPTPMRLCICLVGSSVSNPNSTRAAVCMTLRMRQQAETVELIGKFDAILTRI